jgi:hypothetical protein
MLEIDIQMVLAIFSILSIALGSVVFMVRLWNKAENTMIKNTLVLDSLVEEVGDLKNLEKRITANETEIKLINQRCELRSDNESK